MARILRTMPARRRASARVTTRAGDRGDTSLFGKGRVRKTDPRVEALGDLDEAQAVLGIARAAAPRPLAKTLLDLQRGLYLAMAEVATPRPDLARLPERLDGVVLVGAHCDDIVVGCGGTLLELCRAHPGVQVSASCPS